jgi:hypothetical protein
VAGRHSPVPLGNLWGFRFVRKTMFGVRKVTLVVVSGSCQERSWHRRRRGLAGRDGRRWSEFMGATRMANASLPMATAARG